MELTPCCGLCRFWELCPQSRRWSLCDRWGMVVHPVRGAEEGCDAYDLDPDLAAYLARQAAEDPP